MLVKIMLEAPEVLMHPSRKGRSFIVDEDAPVFNSWFSKDIPAREDKERLL